MTIEHKQLIYGHTPAGAVISFASSSAPEGQLECNGQEISRTEYSKLFESIGVVYGNGDGLLTFNLPDLRGEFIRGWDNGKGIDTGRNFGDSQVGSKSIIQAINNSTGTFPSAGMNKDTLNLENDVSSINVNWGHGITWVTRSATTALQTASVRPRNIALLYCIKY